jgi:hypothetical protein
MLVDVSRVDRHLSEFETGGKLVVHSSGPMLRVRINFATLHRPLYLIKRSDIEVFGPAWKPRRLVRNKSVRASVPYNFLQKGGVPSRRKGVPEPSRGRTAIVLTFSLQLNTF